MSDQVPGVAFFKPTRIKLVFLVEWVLFILIAAARGELGTHHQVLVAGYPLIFFYLVACALTTLSQHIQQIAPSWKLLVLAGGLTILDQAIKTIITAFVPYQTSIPIVNNWLYLAHEHNSHGSWIASAFNVQFAGVFNLVQWGLAIPVLFFSLLCHRYYITTNRKSLWADVALLGLFAGYTSWICDMSLRGYIIDLINLPGLVTADLKDILITIGVAGLFAEMLDNPKLSWRWAGWQKERDDLIRLVTSLCSFCIQELHKARQAVMRAGKRRQDAMNLKPSQSRGLSLVVFFVIAYAASWALWVPMALSSQGMASVQIPPILGIALGGMSPSLTATVLTMLERGKEGFRDLIGGLFRWRVAAHWYLFALFGALALHILLTNLSWNCPESATGLLCWHFSFAPWCSVAHWVKRLGGEDMLCPGCRPIRARCRQV